MGLTSLADASAQRFARSYAGVARVMSNFGVTGGIPRPYNHVFQSISSSFAFISSPRLSVNHLYKKALKSSVVSDLKRKWVK